MNGVEILNQTNVYKVDGEPWIFWLIFGAGFLVGLIWMIIQWVTFGFDIEDSLLLVALTFIGFVVGGVAFICTLDDTDELKYVKYQVTVSNAVSLNEVMDKYEIIDQEGKIYTVKERNQC